MAARGSAVYQAKLDAVPECPEEMQYLVDIARQLMGRSGSSNTGIALLNPTVLKDWLHMMGETLSPREFEAVITLDAVMLHPGKAEPEVQQVAPKVPAAARWPKRKGA